MANFFHYTTIDLNKVSITDIVIKIDAGINAFVNFQERP